MHVMAEENFQGLDGRLVRLLDFGVGKQKLTVLRMGLEEAKSDYGHDSFRRRVLEHPFNLAVAESFRVRRRCFQTLPHNGGSLFAARVLLPQVRIVGTLVCSCGSRRFGPELCQSGRRCFAGYTRVSSSVAASILNSFRMLFPEE